MKQSLVLIFALIGILAENPAKAQTLVDSWTYDGGGLAPATYGNYKPATLVADPSANNGAVINIAGTQEFFAGLGTNEYGPGEDYGGYYTFDNALSFSVSSGTLLAGLESISFSFYSSYDYLQGALRLDFNGSNANLISDDFAIGDEFIYDNPVVPVGAVTMYHYTWTWDVSTLGSTTGFTINWSVASSSHNFMMDYQLTQTEVIPEPSAAGLLAMGSGGMLWLLRSRRNRVSAATDA